MTMVSTVSTWLIAVCGV